ncbi:hypothetical protein SAMN05216553_117109 [Lentzea fradiae]|uniref:GLTT repeat-containing protein n=1 Tax=Lentzea fradiae TaxID=200378 RepID=A0A1G8ABV3_9PSEU|nr:hypothetical protein [Lentzea fradiae]SDH18505.1 hypothetical protein SAMN05216553_117109 [Lentzea fradiae]
MSRSGLFRAAALLAAGATPLLAAGSATAAEVPQLPGGLPVAGAGELLSGATQLTEPLNAATGVQLPHLGAPLTGGLPVPGLPGIAQERSLPSPVSANLGGLPEVRTPEAQGGTTRLSSVHASLPAELPAEVPTEVSDPHVLSGLLPTING